MTNFDPTILIAGASRGIGLAMARQFIQHGWSVIGTARAELGTALHELAEQHGDKVRVEQLDVISPGSIAALRDRLADQRLDALFVNAGIMPNGFGPIEGESDEAFLEVMSTNALAPMRVISALEDLLPADGLVGAMSSDLGSIGNNKMGMGDTYRASKAALNMLLTTYAMRKENADRPVVLLAPGWIQTELGGANATFTLEETVPTIVETLICKRQRQGLEYIDRFGQAVAW